jgi:hypothetical protein
VGKVVVGGKFRRACSQHATSVTLAGRPSAGSYSAPKPE